VSKVDTTSIVKDVIEVFYRYQSSDRLENLNVIAAMLGGIFGVLVKYANPKDCINFINKATAMMGWKEH